MSFGGFGRGGALGGMGRGEPIGGANSTSQGRPGGGGFGDAGGFSRDSGGFGGGSGGFGGRGDDSRGSASGFGGSGFTGGFGSSGGGFGSSGGGFGSGRGGGFDSGGRGGGRGGGSGCRNCGQEGHFAKECTEPRKSSGSCYNCGEEGHMSRECPNPKKSSGGGGGRGCFKCGEEGHMSRECPNNESSAGRGSGGFGGGGGFGSSGAKGFGRSDGGNTFGGGFESGGFGNAGSDSRGTGGFGGGRSGGFGGGESGSGGGFGGRSESGGRGADSGGGCRKCGKDGHFARECPEGGGGDQKCYNCGKPGHRSAECTEPKKAPEPRLDEQGREIKLATYVPTPDSVDEMFSAQIAAGINFEQYFGIPVDILGYDKTRDHPKVDFDELKLTDLLHANIKRMNYVKPTPIQQHALPIIMEGRDLMACAQTGSGKTAAFLLPILATILKDDTCLSTEYSPIQSPNAVIVAPTRELAVQIANEAKKFAHGTMAKAVVVYGGVSVAYQLADLRKGCNILIGTPGRLLDFIGKGVVNLDRVKYVILDEADRMLDMGFEPDMRRLTGSKGLPDKGERQTLMFSATFPQEIQDLAKEFLMDSFVFVVIGIIGSASKDIVQQILQVSSGEKIEKLQEIISEHKVSNTKDAAGNFLKKTLVFVERKRMADFVGSYLSLSDYPTTTIHGDRDQKQREEALRAFKSGKCPVLIATAVAARGLDIVGVDHVINYDLPAQIEDYVHRIGRTGRVGNMGEATSFYDSSSDGNIAHGLVKILSDAEQVIPDWLAHEVGMTPGGGGASGGGGTEWD